MHNVLKYIITTEVLGRGNKMMNLSQENCLSRFSVILTGYKKGFFFVRPIGVAFFLWKKLEQIEILVLILKVEVMSLIRMEK